MRTKKRELSTAKWNRRKRPFKQAKRKFNNAIFLVFSDTKTDIEWCKNNINDDSTPYGDGKHDSSSQDSQQICKKGWPLM